MNKFSKLVAGILVFDLLFFNQLPGLNISIFAVAVWLLILINQKKKQRDKAFLILSISFFLSCFSFAWYGDPLSFFALFVSLYTTGIYSQYKKLHFIFYPVLGIINAISFPFRFFYFNSWLPLKIKENSWQKTLALIIIPFLIFIVFFAIYTTGSSLFATFYRNLFFNFDGLQLFLLTILSFILLFNLWFLCIPKTIIRINSSLKNEFNGEDCNFLPSFTLFDRRLERRGGEITLTLLNLLLTLFIIAYNYEQFFSHSENLSDEIHERITTVIASIILAVAVILFYFRGKGDDKNRHLKRLTYIWIALNSLLLLSALIKNSEYIFSLGLTFKRISVFIFLIICFMGLYFTAIKIKNEKTNFYLINKMMIVFYSSLVISAPINFSWIVTKYNLSFYEKPDVNYLRNLDYNKALLYKTYYGQPQWNSYFEYELINVKMMNNRSILSTSLYDRYLAHAFGLADKPTRIVR